MLSSVPVCDLGNALHLRLIADADNFLFVVFWLLPEPFPGLALPASIRLDHTEEQHCQAAEHTSEFECFRQ